MYSYTGIYGVGIMDHWVTQCKGTALRKDGDMDGYESSDVSVIGSHLVGDHSEKAMYCTS
jgi:hypothetical protein